MAETMEPEDAIENAYLQGEVPNTDDAAPYTVLTVLGHCASLWVPEARLIGNVRAIDIVKACNRATTLLARHGDPYSNGDKE